MFWDKRKEEIETLNKLMMILDNRISECKRKTEKLERILKHAGKEIAFEISDSILYIYYKNREYTIVIKEFIGMDVIYDFDNSVIMINDDIAYLDLKVSLPNAEYYTEVYHYIIDYKNGTYIL